MDIVIVGHVDHGKSTVIGRLLADTGSLPEGKLEQVKENCERNSKPFEYAFLIDALKDEQAQGITIDSARVFFKSALRDYIIIDAPGHIEFLKNMVSGAARAEAALLVIDAAEGIRENSRRHGYMLSMLGVRQIAVVVNKMDLVGYDRAVYDSIVAEYGAFLKEIDIEPRAFIPASGMKGDNIAGTINCMGWYSGKSVLGVLDQFEVEKDDRSKPFRMPVQDVYKFTRFGDSRRIVAGTILTGSIAAGDEIVFYPSGKKSRVKSIESFNARQRSSVEAPYPVGLTLEEQIYVTRGELAVKASEHQPLVSSRIRTSLFWLGKKPMTRQKDYALKMGAIKVQVRLESVHRIIDASDLAYSEDRDRINRHDVAECTLKCIKAVAFDRAEDNTLTSRFVIVDDYEIAGGGIIQQKIDDSQAWIRDKVFVRDYKWEKSLIPSERRAQRYTQKSSLVLISGKRDSGKKALARLLEKELFDDGRIVYFLGIGNILYGVDADIKGEKDRDRRSEHIRRLAEVAHIMMEAGVILIVTAVELARADLDIITTIVDPERITTVWMGDDGSSDMKADLYFDSDTQSEEPVELIKEELQRRGFIFKPW
jgi:bifunctional enzyme CysN/CysC